MGDTILHPRDTTRHPQDTIHLQLERLKVARLDFWGLIPPQFEY